MTRHNEQIASVLEALARISRLSTTNALGPMFERSLYALWMAADERSVDERWVRDAERDAREIMGDGPFQANQVVDLVAWLEDHSAFSQRTFGPGPRTNGLLDHIAKEMNEVRANPSDKMEWIDIAVLAFDGALRAGHAPRDIANAMVAKLAKNKGRKWKDWRTVGQDAAIEHVREGEES